MEEFSKSQIIIDRPANPGFWMHETTGVLKPVVEAYIKGHELTGPQIAVMRAYLRQWINARGFDGPDVDVLREKLDGLISQDAIDDWLDQAIECGVDPL